MNTKALLYPNIQAERAALRIGVMLDSWTPAAWMAEVLQGIQASGIAQVTTVILNGEASAPPVSWWQRIQRCLAGKSGLNSVFWQLYQYFDVKRHPDWQAPFRATDVSNLLKSTRVLEVQPLRRGFEHRFSEADVERVRAEDLDVILRFGFNIVRGEILTVPRHGIWSYHHGDNRKFRGGPACFWEMYERDPLTGCILQILTDELDDGQVIYRSHGATHSFESLLINRWWLYRKCVPFVMRCLRRLYETGDVACEPRGAGQSGRVYCSPGNACMVKFMFMAVTRRMLELVQLDLNIVRDHWYLACMVGRKPGLGSAAQAIPLHPPKGHFWADPCLVERDDRRFVFFEDFEYARNRGVISVLEIDRAGHAGEAQPVLEEDYHLSYPFVFRWQDVDYMIPESKTDHSVRLYRALEFPRRWVFDRVLLEGIAAVDATVMAHEGRWYLFANVSETGGSSWDELFLFVADTPLGPWLPHPMNPIVSDVRSARPAGAFFMQDGKLYRPSQDSSISYGSSIAVQCVNKLSPTEYEESFAYRVSPDWPGTVGCHTLSMTESLTVVDCKTLKWAP